ncbi:hypothetical protein HK102_003860 [Quaeritorhiza haematococci]|nr:hypothetical protein HK102_003860 [Quaeritorhiza haematococci]
MSSSLDNIREDPVLELTTSVTSETKPHSHPTTNARSRPGSRPVSAQWNPLQGSNAMNGGEVAGADVNPAEMNGEGVLEPGPGVGVESKLEGDPFTGNMPVDNQGQQEDNPISVLENPSFLLGDAEQQQDVPFFHDEGGERMSVDADISTKEENTTRPATYSEGEESQPHLTADPGVESTKNQIQVGVQETEAESASHATNMDSEIGSRHAEDEGKQAVLTGEGSAVASVTLSDKRALPEEGIEASSSRPEEGDESDPLHAIKEPLQRDLEQREQNQHIAGNNFGLSQVPLNAEGQETSGAGDQTPHPDDNHEHGIGNLGLEPAASENRTHSPPEISPDQPVKGEEVPPASHPETSRSRTFDTPSSSQYQEPDKAQEPSTAKPTENMQNEGLQDESEQQQNRASSKEIVGSHGSRRPSLAGSRSYGSRRPSLVGSRSSHGSRRPSIVASERGSVASGDAGPHSHSGKEEENRTVKDADGSSAVGPSSKPSSRRSSRTDTSHQPAHSEQVPAGTGPSQAIGPGPLKTSAPTTESTTPLNPSRRESIPTLQGKTVMPGSDSNQTPASESTDTTSSPARRVSAQTLHAAVNHKPHPDSVNEGGDATLRADIALHGEGPEQQQPSVTKTSSDDDFPQPATTDPNPTSTTSADWILSSSDAIKPTTIPLNSDDGIDPPNDLERGPSISEDERTKEKDRRIAAQQALHMQRVAAMRKLPSVWARSTTKRFRVGGDPVGWGKDLSLWG